MLLSNQDAPALTVERVRSASSRRAAARAAFVPVVTDAVAPH
ncbi:hypothetical protein [Plantibacter sp. LMC-P-059a]|jgi:hypothetical protein|nr:hypothetical protein [Plantibacter sp. LMC-P-059a]